MKFLTLTAVNLATERTVQHDPALTGAATPAVDDLELPVNVLPIRPPAPVAEVTFDTFPIVINAAAIREFYPRRSNAAQTRIVVANGAAHIVTQSIDEIKAMVAPVTSVPHVPLT